MIRFYTLMRGYPGGGKNSQLVATQEHRSSNMYRQRIARVLLHIGHAGSGVDGRVWLSIELCRMGGFVVRLGQGSYALSVE